MLAALAAIIWSGGLLDALAQMGLVDAFLGAPFLDRQVHVRACCARPSASSASSHCSWNAFSGTRSATMVAIISLRISATVSDTSVAFMNSLRWAYTSLRWSFITSSYFSTFLRVSKLRASTFFCAFSSALLIQGWTIASPVLQPQLLQHPAHPVGAEDAHQVVFQRQEEARPPRVALAAGPAAQLVVDAPALVAFGADHEQPACLLHLLMRGGDLVADLRLAGGAQAGVLDALELDLQRASPGCRRV